MFQPQEIESLYLLPALRSELCKALRVEASFSQREIAKRLGLTEAAVSYYLNDKRGLKVKLSKSALREVRGTARAMAEGKIDGFRALIALCDSMRQSGELCVVHSKFDKDCPPVCRECMGAGGAGARFK